MKVFSSLLFIAILAAACSINFGKRVKGNGNIISQTRETGNISRIKLRGSINVELVPGNSSVTVEADENLLPYIITRNEDGWLVIKNKDEVNLKSTHPITVYVSADMLSAVQLMGSGNITSKGKFSGADKLDIDVIGSGNVNMEVNTPSITVDIAGSGDVSLAGETRDARIHIAGSGNYEAKELLTETTDIDIAGSGDARVHADVQLKADVLGSGNVYYRGKASVQSNTTGSGKIKPMD